MPVSGQVQGLSAKRVSSRASPNTTLEICNEGYIIHHRTHCTKHALEPINLKSNYSMKARIPQGVCVMCVGRASIYYFAILRSTYQQYPNPY